MRYCHTNSAARLFEVVSAVLLRQGAEVPRPDQRVRALATAGRWSRTRDDQRPADSNMFSAMVTLKLSDTEKVTFPPQIRKLDE